MAIPDDVIATLAPEPLETIGPKIKDGDILLCAAHDPFSRLIAWATQSPWSHVAIAYRWPALNRVMAFESVQKLGVRAVPIEKFISQTSDGTTPFPGDIILARHDAWGDTKLAPENLKRFVEFAVDQFGDPFAPLEIAKIALRIMASRFVDHLPRALCPDDEYICSEYADKCFEHAGIDIEWDGLGFIAPSDFAHDPNVHAIARFKTR
ncbi:MAG TPA: hypothetical protein VG407_07550 [Caulobacteraceae bacterium]|jgi:hypothetical protein|nr:hypothetical protein [Caulobacteraceae bacterium]